MDHFAKPNDELALAQQEGKLHRNFQGYTTKPESELVAFGLTAISMLDNVYVQNHKTLKDFYKSIDEGNIPMERGVKLAKSDNILRREIIMELMCHYKLDKKTIENKYNINFDEYFAEEEHRLESLAKDGLINLLPDKLEVTSTGRLLIRNIAFAFDNYSQNKGEKTFSKAI